jgi:enamine deaminase RidA (YjgF/YER057c/UK114 family)
MAGMELVRVPMLTQDVPYAYAAVARGGTVYAAGACALDEHGDVVAPGDVTAQAELVMRNLEQALRTAQCGLDDVLKTTVYVASADRADLVSAWNAVRAALGDHDPPSTLLGVAVLGYPDQLVEVEAVAECPA